MCLSAIGAAIGGVGSILGGNSAKKGAKKAAAAQLQVAQENNALARDIYGKNEGYLAPFVEQGKPATATINSLLGLTDPAQGQNAFRSFLQNSDYGFQFGEGANKLNSGYAGAGTLQSGAAMKGLESFRQNLQQGYRGDYLNALGNQQGVGLSGASALAGVGQNFVNTISGNNQNAADARSNSALIAGQNNGFANALSGISGTLLTSGILGQQSPQTPPYVPSYYNPRTTF